MSIYTINRIACSAMEFGIALILFMTLLLPALLCGQTVVGTITRPNFRPFSVAVYETGNKIFVADDASGRVYIYDGANNAELGFVSIGAKIHAMVVDETKGKLYAASLEKRKIGVVNAVTGAFIGYLSGTYSNVFDLTQDQNLGKVYALSLEGLTQIDVATDSETNIPGFDGGGFQSMAVNPVSHEIFVTRFIQNVLEIVDGMSLTKTTISGLGGLGIGINWTENKAYISTGGGVGVPFRIYDHDTGSITPIAADNDATVFAFDHATNRVYTDAEVNSISTIIDGPSNAFFNLPMAGATTDVAFRHATGHVYFGNPDFIGILDQETQMLEMIPIDNPNQGGVIIGGIAINQTTGRVYVINDSRLNFVTVVQDTEDMIRPPIYLGGSTEGIQVLDPITKMVADSWIIGGGYYGIAVRPGGGRIYESAGFELREHGGSGSSTKLRVFDIGTGLAVPVITPDGKRIYATADAASKVAAIDLESGRIKDIPLSLIPWGAVMAPDGSKVYVGSRGFESVVSVIDVAQDTVINKIQLSQPPAFQSTWPWGLTINPSGTKLYVANFLTNVVSVINTRTETVIKNIPVGEQPRWVAVTPDGRHVYVSNSRSGTVSIIDAGADTVIKTVTVGPDPRGIGALPDGSAVFVVNHNSFSTPSLSVINTNDFSVATTPLPAAGVRSLTIADPTSKFAGRVTKDGAPLEGGMVRALQAGVEKRTATTNAAGDYSIFNLRPGAYDIEASIANSAPQVVPSKSAGAGQTTIVNFDFQTTGVQSREELPAHFSLSQNYPNPFNPTTTIGYALPKRSDVNLSIYDILGRKIAVLENEEKEAGSYEVKWQTHDASSGVYFYRLQAGSFVQVKKLLLIR
jgi:YVTN family beta-propeller protein